MYFGREAEEYIDHEDNTVKKSSYAEKKPVRALKIITPNEFKWQSNLQTINEVIELKTSNKQHDFLVPKFNYASGQFNPQSAGCTVAAQNEHERKQAEESP